MDIKCTLAMTNHEIADTATLPRQIAWMACHFSSEGEGLSDLPVALPKNQLILVDDSIPLNGHDPQRIAQQLRKLTEEFSPEGIILDLQRADMPENAALAKVVAEKCPCRVCVSALYAPALNCPVLLPPPPPHIPLSVHLAPWKGRTVWLEAVLEAEIITVTDKGSSAQAIPLPPIGSLPFTDEEALCRYSIRVLEDRAIFTLARDAEMLKTLLQQAEQLGVEKAVGLYQQLGTKSPEVR